MYLKSPETPHDANLFFTDEEETSGKNVGDSSKQGNKLTHFFFGDWRHKRWTLPLTILAIIAVILAVPMTRYPILAYGGLTQPFTVHITDSRTGMPVSGAQVVLGGHTQTTNSTGKAIFHAKIGSRVVYMHMKYYKQAYQNIFVGIRTIHNMVNVQLDATGRQVPIMVMDKITGKAVADVDVKVLDTAARTDQSGMATIVLPTSSATQPATITARGYNETSAHIQITDKVVPANTFDILPTGRVYFLSNLTGSIDVVSTDLDGANRATVLAGTGSEDANTTMLSAAHDWKYLALVSKRDGGQHAKLFVINTATSQVTAMDSDIGDFTPIGWSGHYFVYEVSLLNTNSWQSGKTVLRSYNADTGKILSIDQTIAQGTDAAYIYNYFGFANIVNDRVVYGMSWNDFNSNYLPNNLGGQKVTLMSAAVSTDNKQDLRDITISNGVTYAYAASAQYAPQVLYIQTALGSQSSVYYTYQYQNNSVTQSSTITSASFAQVQQNHVAYLVSPSGNTTFWSEQRDGENTLFTGDASGANRMQIAAQSNYAAYAWFTDTYLLVQKSNNELYIMPATGGTPLKVSNYYHPNAVLFNNNGIGNYGTL